MEKLGICLHGVTLTLEANHPPLLAYAAEHLNGLVEAPVCQARCRGEMLVVTRQTESSGQPLPDRWSPQYHREAHAGQRR